MSFILIKTSKRPLSAFLTETSRNLAKRIPPATKHTTRKEYLLPDTN